VITEHRCFCGAWDSRAVPIVCMGGLPTLPGHVQCGAWWTMLGCCADFDGPAARGVRKVRAAVRVVGDSSRMGSWSAAQKIELVRLVRESSPCGAADWEVRRFNRFDSDSLNCNKFALGLLCDAATLSGAPLRPQLSRCWDPAVVTIPVLRILCCHLESQSKLLSDLPNAHHQSSHDISLCRAQRKAHALSIGKKSFCTWESEHQELTVVNGAMLSGWLSLSWMHTSAASSL